MRNVQHCEHESGEPRKRREQDLRRPEEATAQVNRVGPQMEPSRSARFSLGGTSTVVVVSNWSTVMRTSLPVTSP